jgi:hypothetical protein
VLWLLALAGAALGQQMERPPDYSQPAVAVASNDLYSAWKALQASDQDLEQQVFALPMVDARQRIQTTFSSVLAYIDKRRAYGEAVAACIATMAADSAGAGTLVSVDAMNADEMQQLGSSISAVQRKLDILRSMPEWLQIRRGVQKDRSEVLELQRKRREDIQIERPMDRSNSSARPVSATVYRDSERQVQEALTRLWTHYYQALVGAVEQRQGQSTPLVASAGGAGSIAAGTSAGAAAQPAPAGGATNSAVVGTWTYVEGAEQFNGVAEPKRVILELWMEKGFLVGRYRAELPDFDQTKAVDLKLRGKPEVGRIVLDFQSTSPEAAGKIILEGPGSSGMDLMLVRSAEGTPIPRGRELLTRR